VSAASTRAATSYHAQSFSADSQCDWPANVDCKVTVESVRKQQREDPTVVYLTFDDGPNEGSPAVLDALAAAGVRATFFINAERLQEDAKKPGQAELNAASLVRMVQEGHVLADHSYDHMFHNSPGPRNAYLDLQRDYGYFGARNLIPVLAALKAGDVRDEATLAYVEWTMTNIVRMPYSNNWRVYVPPNKSHPRGLNLIHSCVECTIPAPSGRMGATIADLVSETGTVVAFS